MTAKSNKIISALLNNQYRFLVTKPYSNSTHLTFKPEVFSQFNNGITNLSLEFATLSPIVGITQNNNKLKSNVAFVQNHSKALGILHLKSRFNGNAQLTRFYSTHSPFFIQHRSMGKKKCKKSKRCKKKKRCPKPCPKWCLKNCPPQKKQYDACVVKYTDPCCKKKLSPYPSYSETCAKRLDDDPSECMQCPWSKCGGVETVKHPKRKYHTCPPSFNINSKRFFRKERNSADIQESIPSPLNLEDVSKKIKYPPISKKKRSIHNWTTKYRVWSSKDLIPKEIVANGNIMTVSTENRDNRYKDKLNSNMITPDTDAIAKEIFFTRDSMDLAKKHDKGYPPPCPHWRRKSKKCPKKKRRKKPLRQQRDLREPVFRRQREPWIEDQTGHGKKPKDKYW